MPPNNEPSTTKLPISDLPEVGHTVDYDDTPRSEGSRRNYPGHSQSPEAEGLVLKFKSVSRVFWAEFFGTAILALFGKRHPMMCTAANNQVALSNSTAVSNAPAGTYLSVAVIRMGFGCVKCWAFMCQRALAAGMCVLSHLNLINPAITLAMAIFRGFPWKRVYSRLLGSTIDRLRHGCSVSYCYLPPPACRNKRDAIIDEPLLVFKLKSDFFLMACMIRRLELQACNRSLRRWWWCPNDREDWRLVFHQFVYLFFASVEYSRVRLQNDPFFEALLICAIYRFTRLPYVSNANCFYNEFLMTAILMLVVVAVGDTGNAAPPKNMAPLVVFWTVFGLAATLGMQTSFALNPARDLGPRLVTWFAGYGSHVWSIRSHVFKIATGLLWPFLDRHGKLDILCGLVLIAARSSGRSSTTSSSPLTRSLAPCMATPLCPPSSLNCCPANAVRDKSSSTASQDKPDISPPNSYPISSLLFFSCPGRI
ncbi:hypothetical protein VP01_1848g2 [Puccinia sorghi]|uniref:Aquaporin n=1 Tax=Puccinia sorghi TaxID=27349 RepID=A0A0L6VE84_9BASI|nr:hypothetical protein VP01_1848g2 [Puccinia sorghi]